MKKEISLIVVLLFSLSVFPQRSSEAIMEDMQRMFEASNKAVKEKDYQGASVLLDSLIESYNSLPKEEREMHISSLASMYYNKACFESMLNHKQEALDYFEEAIRLKWNDYGHALQDSDLDNIRNEERFDGLMAELRKIGDFLYILKKSPEYNSDLPQKEFKFTYLEASDSNLVRIRRHFNLDSIAGKGDEISQIKNLMTWVHNRVRHDGNSSNPASKNAIDIINVCDTENRGVNCRMLATVLNECYLAMGFKSRFITCMPKEYINDCHVINAVYSDTLGKWLWMDPTFDAYVSDEKGDLLSIAEVRERLRAGKPLVLNEDANWNNEQKQTKEYYLDSYMAKNLYWLTAAMHSGYNVETTRTAGGYVDLFPSGFSTSYKSSEYLTTNDKLFWEE